MTREEKIALLVDELEDIRCDNFDADTNEDKTLKEAVRVIKVLAQEPCGDVINRQAVDTLVDELARAISDERCFMSRGRDTSAIMQDILDLPSVNPQEPKTGHWIRMKTYEKWECSECNTVFRFTFKEHDYCPNCGSAMKEE